MRATNLIVIAVVVVCQAVATVSFQSATNNRIITPSIMGFERSTLHSRPPPSSSLVRWA